MSDQKKILFKNEIKVLEGPRKINIFILAGILLLSFIGLGHSVGGLKYLGKRMDNPFTKWVNLPVNTAESGQRDALLKYFASQSLRDSFLLDTIRGYKRDAYKFVSPDGKKSQFKRTRTVDVEEDLLKEIIKPSNLLYSNIKEDITSEYGHCWLIVKEEALSQLGFNMPLKDINMMELRLSESEVGERAFSFYFPVVAVVKDLPDQADIIISEHLEELLNSPYEQYKYVEVGETNNWSFLSATKVDAESLKDILPDSTSISELENDDTLNINGQERILHTLFLDHPVSLSQKFLMLEYLQSKTDVLPYHKYECNVGENLFIKDAQYLAINFKDLRHVRAFRDRVKNEFSFEITLNQIEDKENFSLVTRLTILLAFILLLVSLAGVIIFIVNLLIAHFDKIQSNLGTFKAFGLSNVKLLDDYTKITLLFFSKSLLWAILLTMVYYGLMVLINGKFTVFHWSFPVVIFMIFVVVYFIIQKIIHKKLSKTPGDLIYNR